MGDNKMNLKQIIEIYVWDYWQEKDTFYLILEVITNQSSTLRLIKYAVKE